MTFPARGVVREWWPEEGWGVVDSDETPGGCWIHYSAVRVRGYRSLSPGDPVEMLVERFDQDGYPYRADSVWPAGREPVDHAVPMRDAAAYSSGLLISFDRSEVEVTVAGAGDLDAVVDVWRRAREAAGAPPAEARVARVQDKVRDPDALVVTARTGGRVVGMALLEPFRGDSATAHVSMVFVDPAHQGRGVGASLLHAAHTLAGLRGWTRSSVWTRESNAAARALYATAGFVATDDLGATPDGEPTRRWVR